MSFDSITPSICAAQVVLRCSDLSASIRFLTTLLGFKVRMIMPSDSPTVAVLSAHGCTIRLEASANVEPGASHLHLLCEHDLLPPGTPSRLLGPDGLQVDLQLADAPVHVPAGIQEFVLTRLGGPESWGVGRAGMLYRDLIPSRLNGRFVASHILIEPGGPVPDYVHYHRVRFQFIFCKAGWVRLVYEDQGDPFILNAGDCVLQPPEIRHRVLESSPNAEVIEIGCPAIHETFGDPEMDLPTGAYLPERIYQSQTFIRHIAADATWRPSRLAGFEARDTGIASATEGLGGVSVLRPLRRAQATDDSSAAPGVHHGELLFVFVLAGQSTLNSRTLGKHLLRTGDSCVIPAGADYHFSPDAGLELLEVTLPAARPA